MPRSISESVYGLQSVCFSVLVLYSNQEAYVTNQNCKLRMLLDSKFKERKWLVGIHDKFTPTILKLNNKPKRYQDILLRMSSVIMYIF